MKTKIISRLRRIRRAVFSMEGFLVFVLLVFDFHKAHKYRNTASVAGSPCR